MISPLGIDTDNYDGAVSTERYSTLKALGITFCIVGCETGSNGNFTHLQTANAKSAGLEVPFSYKFLYWNDNDLEGIKRAAGFGLPVAIDCESHSGMPQGPDATVDRISHARDLLQQEGLYWGIYTGKWWWPQFTRNSALFAQDNLWHAAYPFGEGKLPPPNFRPDFSSFQDFYGGWLTPKVWQFADVAPGEPSFDLNAWNPTLQENIMPDISLDGAQRFTSEGTFMTIYNGNIPVWRWGSTDGQYPGRMSKNFGGLWWWFRTLDDNGQFTAPYFSQTEGD